MFLEISKIFLTFINLLKLNKYKKLILKFLNYNLAGFINTTISYIVYILLIKIGVFYIYSNILTWILILFISFYNFRKIVWKNKNSNFILFAVISIVQLFLTTFFLFILVDFLNLNQNLAPILNILFFFIIKFFILDKYVFNN